MDVSRDRIGNSFLRALQPEDFSLIKEHLTPIDLPRRTILVEENKPIEWVYFPVTGFASIVALTPNREMIEVGAFGFEGCSNFAMDGAENKVPLRTFMQVEGQGWRIRAAQFATAIQGSSTFLSLVMRYEQYKATQFAYTALAHGSFTIPERLAAWLLMAQDRLGHDFQIVHEFLAMMLAVRRAGVTEALHKLEGAKAIKCTRGRIRVLDRALLVQIAAGSYGVPEREYERLIGPLNLHDETRPGGPVGA